MSTRHRGKQLIRWLAIALMAPLVIIVGARLCVLVWATLVDKPPPIEEITTPLEPAVAQDMCQKMSLRNTDRRCQEGAVVYAEDFAQEIRVAFEPGVSTYADVQEVFGPYQYECEEPVYYRSLNVTVFRCWYDLRGDRVYRIGFGFTDDGVLRAIYASPRDSGG